MEMPHLDESTMRRLEHKRWLLREQGRITEDSLRSLCREHPEEIPFETLDEDTKRMLITDYERHWAQRYLSIRTAEIVREHESDGDRNHDKLDFCGPKKQRGFRGSFHSMQRL
jgi:hypothetical protein